MRGQGPCTMHTELCSGLDRVTVLPCSGVCHSNDTQFGILFPREDFRMKKYWWLALVALILGAILGFVWPASADPLQLFTRR